MKNTIKLSEIARKNLKQRGVHDTRTYHYEYHNSGRIVITDKRDGEKEYILDGWKYVET